MGMIIVMGLPGAGKSTVLQVAQENGWTVLNYGTLMFEIAQEKLGIASRDEIRKLDAHHQKEIQRLVGQKLAAIKDPRVILDTHCSVNTPKGYLPGLPHALLREMDVERLVLITAPIEDVLRRRRADSTRSRDDQSEASLREHDDINRAYLAAYSALTGAPAVILTNADGQLDAVRTRFSGLLG